MPEFRFVIALIVMAAFFPASRSDAQVDNTQRIEKVREYVTQAGSLFKNELFEESGKRIKSAQSLIQRAFDAGTETDREALETEYRRIAKAHELLAGKGIELPELMAFPETFGSADEPGIDDRSGTDASTKENSDLDGDSPDSTDEQTVSFKEQIAPLFVQHCGNCHVSGSKGKFNMGTFEKLLAGAKGKAIVPGKPDESRIVELIETGEMPPAGRGAARSEFPGADLELIKSWILQGSKFDGEDKKAPIAGNQNTPPGRGP